MVQKYLVLLLLYTIGQKIATPITNIKQPRDYLQSPVSHPAVDEVHTTYKSLSPTPQWMKTASSSACFKFLITTGSAGNHTSLFSYHGNVFTFTKVKIFSIIRSTSCTCSTLLNST